MKTFLYMCEECWPIKHTQTPIHFYICVCVYKYIYIHAAQLYPSHLNCRASSPAHSIGALSLTTDIILIAHHGRVVCPHSHPDSLCAQNPTTENSGLRVSESLRTAVSVRCVSPKSVLFSCLPLAHRTPQKHGNKRTQAQSDVLELSGTEARGDAQTGRSSLYICWGESNLPSSPV